MHRIIIALLAAGLSTVMLGVWWFYGEVIVVWASVLVNLIKGLSLKLVLTELLGLFSRWFFVELPKRFLMLLVTIGMPSRYRRVIKHYLWRARELARGTAVYLRSKLTGLAGENMALFIAIVATLAVAAIGFMSFGFYFVWIFGGAQVWRAVVWGFELVKHMTFKVMMFFQLDRFGRWLMAKVPITYASWYRRKKQRALRHAVRQRRVYRRFVKRASRRGFLRIAARTSKVSGA